MRFLRRGNAHSALFWRVWKVTKQSSSGFWILSKEASKQSQMRITPPQTPHLSLFWEHLEYWRLFCDSVFPRKKLFSLKKNNRQYWNWNAVFSKGNNSRQDLESILLNQASKQSQMRITPPQKPHLGLFWKDLEYWRVFCDPVFPKKKWIIFWKQPSVFKILLKKLKCDF